MSGADAIYGKTIRCVRDADAIFSSCSGLDVVFQDVIHRLTTSTVLGPGGDDWGYDCRKMVGMKVSEVAIMGPVLSEIVCRDRRILTADISIITEDNGDGVTSSATISGDCTTDVGPFSFVLPVNEVSEATFSSQ